MGLIPKEVEDSIRELLRRGISREEISKRTGIPPSMIPGHRRERAVKNGRPVCAWCETDLSTDILGMNYDRPVHPNRRYCCDRCRTQANRRPWGPKERKCAFCETPLKPFKSRVYAGEYVKENRLYCSTRCRVAAHRKAK